MNGGKRAGLQGDHRLASVVGADIDRRRSHVHELGVFLAGFALILDGCEKLSERTHQRPGRARIHDHGCRLGTLLE